MTKELALKLLLEYVNKHGIPVNDALVYRDAKESEWADWTFKGLSAFLIEG